MDNTVKMVLKIDGMYCNACAISIDFDLEDLEGVKYAKTNYAKQETEIEFEEKKVTINTILSAIKHTGYGVKIKE